MSITATTEASEASKTEISVGEALQATGDAANQAIEAASDAAAAKPTEESAKPAEADDKFASKFAALTRKEKEIARSQKQFEARMKALEEREKAFEADRTAKYVSVDEFQANPLEALEKKFNMPFKQIAELVMNDGKLTPEQQMSQTEKRLQAKIDAMEKQLQERDKAQSQAELDKQLAGFKNDMVSFIDNNPTEYEMIVAEDAHDMVYQVIEEHYNKTADEQGENGEVLSYKVAADAVENHLLDQAKNLVNREKIKKLLQPTPATPPQKAVETGAKTLSNAHATQAGQTNGKRLSDEESKALAAKLLKWS